MKINYLLVLILFSVRTFAQEFHCGTDRVMREMYAKNPQLKLKKEAEDKKTAVQKKTATSSTYIIPIVFHVLHVNGPENVSDPQVKDAVRILNRDFAKRNPDTTDIIPAFKNLADSTKIQFVLATKDPLGNCTNGIVHYYDTDTDWDDTSPTLYSHTWDPTKYLNVYVVRKIILTGGFGAAGYTYFPGTFMPGDPMDAIVVLNNYFGSIGTGNDFLSRVLTHEVGHWLDLYHVFGGTNGAGIDCTGDDFVGDTPPSIGYLNCPNPSVPSQYQLCNPGISENFQNYMDYSYCCRMFTQGQSQRMQQALQSNLVGRDNLVSATNLMATGVVNPNTVCVPIADFKYSRLKTCVGTPVTFSDASWNGTAMSYTWSFPGGTPSSSNASLVTVTYANPGNYSVGYSTSNQAGSSSPLTKTNLINVTSSTAQYSTPWTEDFENLTQLNTNWTIENASGATKWEQSSDASFTGTYSAKLDATNNTRRSVTAMIGPMVNISTASNPHLTFKVAAAEITPNHVNSLKVFASIDCGNTWSLIYNKSGQTLITTSSSAADFVPLKSEWRTEVVSLQSIGSSNAVSFKFEYKRDTIPAANNIYIDDINIMSATAIDEYEQKIQNLNVFPVPSNGSFDISFSIISNQKIRFVLTDIAGRELEQILEANFAAGENTSKLILTNRYQDGMYFLKMEIGGIQYSRKIILKE